MFRFKHFSLAHERSTLKIGTDSVLLGAAVPIEGAKNVLDIGCGCGVIGFCIADRLRRIGQHAFHVTGVDVDADSISEATENAHTFPLDEKIHFSFENIDIQHFNSNKKFNLIVCNPPFFAHSLKPDDEKRLLSRHRDDVLPFSELIENAERLLEEDGKFYVILPSTEIADFQRESTKKLSLCEIISIRPTPKKAVSRHILGFSRSARLVQRNELTIRDENSQFTDAYRSLTRDFYLDF